MKVKVSVTNIPRDKPDLVITAFGVDGDRAWYKIKNIGAINAKQSTAMLYVQGDRRASGMIELLPAGDEMKAYFNNYSWGYGANRSYSLPVRICADGMDTVGEYDENNNCLVVDW
jgi:subtilase family serine protease